jgi:hypothetical protein
LFEFRCLTLELVGTADQVAQQRLEQRVLAGCVGAFDRVPDLEVGRGIRLDETAFDRDPAGGELCGARGLRDGIDAA